MRNRRDLRKIIIRIIDKIRYPLIYTDKYRYINTERANVVHEVWTEIQTTGKCSLCAPHVDRFKNVNGKYLKKHKQGSARDDFFTTPLPARRRPHANHLPLKYGVGGVVGGRVGW